MKEDEKKLVRSMVIPGFIVILMWAVKLIETIGGYDFAFLGIYPRSWQGLPGIITTPFIHGGFSHLIANTVPMIVLGTALFYFYKDIAWRILILIWLFTGFWVWVAARESFHIGASGIVYGLAAFILVSGILRRHTGLMAVALVVVFLYGSLIWGLFPDFFPKENISWESHLFGLLAGFSLAIFYRKEGPQRRLYSWELEDEDNDENENEKDDDDKDAYWNITLTDEEIKEIRHIYKKGG